MRFIMNPDMVYQYPIWAVGRPLVWRRHPLRCAA